MALFRLKAKDRRGHKIGSPHFTRVQVGETKDEVTGKLIPLYNEIETKPGEEIESDLDLIAKFPERFELVVETNPAEAEAKNAEIAELKAKIEALQARLATDTTPETLNLKATPESKAQNRTSTPAEVEKAKKAEEADKESVKADPRGTDVTDDFGPVVGFSVFRYKKGGKDRYAVYDSDGEVQSDNLTKSQVGDVLSELA